MPWIPAYLTQIDATELLIWLNNEDQVAFIVRDGSTLVAKSRLEEISDGRLCIWHTSARPLPWYRQKRRLIRTKEWVEDVPDPWSGWQEEIVGADGDPWFGSDVGIVWFNVRTTSTTLPGAIGMSDFEWIGNRYAPIGHKAPDSTLKWWRRLRGWIDRKSQRIPRSGPMDGKDKEIFAFPDAVKFIGNGGGRDDNP